jgi:hypothetical protein
MRRCASAASSSAYSESSTTRSLPAAIIGQTCASSQDVLFDVKLGGRQTDFS